MRGIDDFYFVAGNPQRVGIGHKPGCISVRSAEISPIECQQPAAVKTTGRQRQAHALQAGPVLTASS